MAVADEYCMSPCQKDIPTVDDGHILAAIRDIVLAKRGETFATWYDSKGIISDKRTFGEIWEGAGKIAYYLRCAWGVKKGERVILCYDFGLHFFEVFLGCLRAGVTAVLVYPPGPPLKKSLAKLNSVVNNCTPALILTDTKINRARLLDKSLPLSKTRSLWPSHVPFKATDALSAKEVPPYDEATASSDIAFLQYTSGSTGDPKGVMVSFQALAANVKLIRFYYSVDQDFLSRDDDGQEIVGFSWLPQYHDLGLVQGLISPFTNGWRMHMISPITFIQQPLIWPELMSKHKVQWSAAPDFSFQLVARKFVEANTEVGTDRPIPGLDLSSIRFLQSAGEPCRPETQSTFSRLFRPYGLREDWYVSAYGLAENVVGVSYMLGLELSRPREEDMFKMYVANGRRSLMCPSLTTKIVDPKTLTEVEDGVTGELWIAGPSVAAGYFGRPALSRETFNARLSSAPGVNFLRTGDLAFFQSDHLYICGRIKDIVIYNGVNYYPQDLEIEVQKASTAVRPGCVAAFAATEAEDETTIEIVFEIRKARQAEVADVCNHIRAAIAQNVGLPVGRVVAISERFIPKTTSGKIRRLATRTALHDGKLDVVHISCGTALKVGCAPGGATQEQLPESLKQRSFNDIVGEIFGSAFDPDLTWEELGLSSLASLELRDGISAAFLVTLSPTFLEEYPTPSALRKFVEENTHDPFPTKTPKLPGSSSCRDHRVGWVTSSVIQGIAVLLLFVVVAVTFVPAFHFGRFLASKPNLSASTERIQWQWLPFVIPVWMLSLSLCTIASKWIIIGKYTELEVSVPSCQFLRWWFVDRLVSVWEFFVGNYIKDTPLLWLFYSLMGARIHPSSTIDAFVHEFDLVDVGSNATIEYDIICRRFSPWESDNSLRLRFRRIHIGSRCLIRGHVGLGASVGVGSVVERLSAVPEGAQIPDGAVARGSPASNHRESSEPLQRRNADSCSRLLALGSFKIFVLVFELYLLFTYFLMGQWILNDRLPEHFRYTPLLYWTILLLLSNLLSIASCILFKWLLIGRRRPGPASTSLWTECTDWFVDYHYRLSLQLFDPLVENTKLHNLYLMALGMNVDMKTQIWSSMCSPSKVDLLTVKRSTFSHVIFEPKQDQEYRRIEAVESSFGHTVILKGGAKVRSSAIAPFSSINADIVGRENVSFQSADFFTLMLSAVTGGILLMSTIPAYELFQCDAGDPAGVGFMVIKFAAVLLTQSATWLLLFCLFQRTLMKTCSVKEWGTRRLAFYNSYLRVNYYITFRWSLLGLAFGTPLINWYFECLGSRIEGRMLSFSGSIYDFPLLTFRQRALVDRNAHVTGHSLTKSGVVFGRTTAAGVLHDAVILLANVDATGENELGPWRFIAPENRQVSLEESASSTKRARPLEIIEVVA